MAGLTLGVFSNVRAKRACSGLGVLALPPAGAHPAPASPLRQVS
jgi:hypothetical protein